MEDLNIELPELESDETNDAFQAEFQELDKTPLELAKQMQSWGDHRSLQAILRSIQRMTAGSTIVSGEMRVIVNMMLYQQHQDQEKYANLEWQIHSNKSVSTVADEFTLTLYPQTKGRWAITIVHKDGYSHPWPTWQENLEAAKRKSLICLADAIRHLNEYKREQMMLRGE